MQTFSTELLRTFAAVIDEGSFTAAGARLGLTQSAVTAQIKRLEAQAGCVATPIAMFTANAMDEHLALAAAAGANHHISKPITPERLLAGIELALGSVEASEVDVAV